MINDDSFGLEAEVVKNIRAVLARHCSVKKAIIYGSRAKGTFKPGSDIDLTLLGDNLNTTDLLQIGTALDELMIAYKIDLSLFEQIQNRHVVDHIERSGKIFYEK